MNHQRRITLLTRVALPALAGCLIATAIPRPSAAALQHLAASRQVVEERSDFAPRRPLPDDPALIKLAAAAGRTGEAKKRLADILAAVSRDEEMVEWLAAILTSEPAWLDTFILTVPEDRRNSLIEATLEFMAGSQPEAAWDLLKHSAAALAVSRGNPKPDSGFDLDGRSSASFLRTLMNNPGAGEHLLDPALGFGDSQIDDLLAHGGHVVTQANADLIFREFQAGRWKSSVPQCVLYGWEFFNDEQRSQIEQNASPELTAALVRMKAATELWTTRDLTAVDLNHFDPEELQQYVTGSGGSGPPVPLEALSRLSPELQDVAVERYLFYLYPDRAAQAEATLARLDDLPLTPGQKERLLLQGAQHEWTDLGHLDAAMQLLSRVPDEVARARGVDRIFMAFVVSDPQGALDYAQRMEPGPQRDELIERSTANLP